MINISSLNALVATPVNDLMGALGFILSVSIFVVIALLIARFRSFLAAIWFIPAFSQLTYFVIFRFYEIVDPIFCCGIVVRIDPPPVMFVFQLVYVFDRAELV